MGDSLLALGTSIAYDLSPALKAHSLPPNLIYANRFVNVGLLSKRVSAQSYTRSASLGYCMGWLRILNSIKEFRGRLRPHTPAGDVVTSPGPSTKDAIAVITLACHA